MKQPASTKPDQSTAGNSMWQFYLLVGIIVFGVLVIILKAFGLF